MESLHAPPSPHADCAVCCSVFQYVAVCCSVLQHVLTFENGYLLPHAEYAY